MRVTLHTGRVGLAQHNDRTAGIGEHVDTGRTADNLYMARGDAGVSRGAPTRPFGVVERAYYAQAYQMAVDATNARYRAQGHADRCTTTDALLAGKRTQPIETILQIGKAGETVSDKTLAICVSDYLRRLQAWADAHGKCLHVLDIAVHLDEDTPHAHVRYCMDYIDRDGLRRLGQSKALERAGIELPDPTKPEGRYNNRMMTLTAMMRSMWQEVCKDHGLIINTETVQTSKRARKVEHRDQLDQDIVSREVRIRELDYAIKEREQMQGTITALQEEIADLGQKRDVLAHMYHVSEADIETVRKASAVRKICHDAIDKLAEAAQTALDYLAEADRTGRGDADIIRQASAIRDHCDRLKEVSSAIDEYMHDDDYDDEYER